MFFEGFRQVIQVLKHFPDHAQNKVSISAGGPARFLNMANWVKKVKILKVSERINDKTSTVSQNNVIRDCGH